MAVNTQFSIAVHLLAGLACRRGGDATSGELAASVNTSPSFVRRVLAKLSKAGLVATTTGKAGACRLAREPRDTSLLDVYRGRNLRNLQRFPERCFTREINAGQSVLFEQVPTGMVFGLDA